MRIDIDGQAWDRGFWDGEAGKPLNSSPYGPRTSASLSWSSGYIEGKAFRNGFIATPPGSCVPLRKNALAAEPYAVPLRFTASGSAPEYPGQRGVKIRRRLGVKVQRRLTHSRAACASAPDGALRAVKAGPTWPHRLHAARLRASTSRRGMATKAPTEPAPAQAKPKPKGDSPTSTTRSRSKEPRRMEGERSHWRPPKLESTGGAYAVRVRALQRAPPP